MRVKTDSTSSQYTKMAQAVGVQLHGGFLSSLFVQATSECLLNTYGSPGTGLVQCITPACSCQKPLHFSPIMLSWLLGSSVQKSGIFGGMISLSDQTSLWPVMLVNRHLNGVSCRFLLKGQLNSVTQKVFGRQCGPKEEFNRLNLSVGLSTSRHNLIPQGRTT